MGKTRNITAQLKYALQDNTHFGESKRAYKNQHNGKTNERVFGIKTAKKEVDDIKSLGKFLKENYPDVRMAKDINSKHVQSWINANTANWSNQTILNKISTMHKLEQQINATYHANIKWELHRQTSLKRENVRNVAFTREDLNRTEQYLKNGKSQALKALQITARCGLRVNEVACLKAEHINLDKNVIEIREGAKNNKWRDVPIRPGDRAFFADLKRNCETVYVTDGVQPNSLNRGIRRAMHSLGISNKYKVTTEHAIRKMYATERMTEEQAAGRNERDAWCIVQQELGHGKNFRQELYNTYVK